MQLKQRLLDPPFEVIGTESMAAGARRHDGLALMCSLKCTRCEPGRVGRDLDEEET
jgi:hypothetical protein